MLTEFGKRLRKLRIDKDERLIDMADRIGKSAAYISAVETGRKPPSDDLVDVVIRVYDLDSSKAEDLRAAAAAGKKTFQLQPETILGRDTAALLARKFDSLSPEEMEKIRTILLKGETE
jgi:transcriptional regulator with XRE-family HTH domain